MKSKIPVSNWRRVDQWWRSRSSVCRVAKKLSARALSKQSPGGPHRRADVAGAQRPAEGQGGVLGKFRWSSQHPETEVVEMTNKHQRQQAVRVMRGKMWSPGRPSTARREDRVRFWEAIARGLSSEDAAAEAGVASAVGIRWFREAGGMPSLTLAPMSGRYLSFAEREEIAMLHAQQLGVREIARRIERSPSTVSRELRRNASTRSNELTYRATTAQWHAERRASRPKVAKLAANDRLRDYVQDRLAGTIARADGELVSGPEVRFIGRRHGRRADRRWAKAWSPEQISNRLTVDFPDDVSMRISHEAIYQALYIQGRGALKRELVACLRTGRALRIPRARTRGRGKKFVTPEIMISERPAEAADRAVPGHWEGDLILGLNRSAIGTLVERTTRFTMLLRLPPMDAHGLEPRTKNGPALAGHGAEAVRDAIVDTITTLPAQLRRSLTWDQGAEMAQHAQLRIDTGLASTSAIRRAPGSAGPTRTPTGCCASISRRAPTSPGTLAVTSTPSPSRSTRARVRPSDGGHPPRPWTSFYALPDTAALRRALEPEQFTSWTFSQRVRSAGLAHSLGSVGDAFDNAVVESFWARMQTELPDSREWRTHTELSTEIFDWIEVFYNRSRRHSAWDARSCGL